MQKTLVIILISLHSIANMELSQLFRLPELLQHYAKTRQQDKSVNFFDFISMHYCGDDGDRSDDAEDRNLPFMSYHTPTVVAEVTAVSTEIGSVLSVYPDSICEFYILNSESPGFTNSLFRPPCFL